jgi:hypothetical protein
MAAAVMACTSSNELRIPSPMMASASVSPAALSPVAWGYDRLFACNRLNSKDFKLLFQKATARARQGASFCERKRSLQREREANRLGVNNGE